ncbi:unnamed protein product [Prunus armeniaca]
MSRFCLLVVHSFFKHKGVHARKLQRRNTHSCSKPRMGPNKFVFASILVSYPLYNSGFIEIQLLLSLYVPLKSLSIEKKNRPKLITGTLALFMYLELCYVIVTYDLRVFLNISTS